MRPTQSNSLVQIRLTPPFSPKNKHELASEIPDLLYDIASCDRLKDDIVSFWHGKL
jgi:hypothetical protein